MLRNLQEFSTAVIFLKLFIWLRGVSGAGPRLWSARLWSRGARSAAPGCAILTRWSGIEPRPPALDGAFWTTGKAPTLFFCLQIFLVFYLIPLMPGILPFQDFWTSRFLPGSAVPLGIPVTPALISSKYSLKYHFHCEALSNHFI